MIQCFKAKRATTSEVTIRLNNGMHIPQVAMGTWQQGLDKAVLAANPINNAVEAAIDCGYRHFDCAYIYLVQ